ncbi:MAG TPA: helix-turn-helix domain-containing protein [Anaerolineaceae bacterium]
MPENTRQRILQFLQVQRRCTVTQLSIAFQLTRPNIRYHLERLVETGAVEMEVAKPAARSRGRPEHTFRLALTSRPNNLAQLADILLDQVGGEEDLRRVAEILAAGEDLPRQPTQRLNRVIQLLNLKRYQARWEAHSQSPRIIFRNCPYAAVLPNHPELCRLDAHMLEQYLGTPVEQLARMEIFSSQPPACVFALRAAAAQHTL